VGDGASPVQLTRQLQPPGQEDAALGHLVRELHRAQDGGLAHLAHGVAVVRGRRADGGGEDGVADDVDADVGALDEALELGRAPADPVEPGQVVRLEGVDDRAHPADRLVDHPPVPGEERPHLVRIVAAS
jgi:hypothetical protein